MKKSIKICIDRPIPFELKQKASELAIKENPANAPAHRHLPGVSSHGLKIALETQIYSQVAQRRLELLKQAERTVTQRFNLFDKVLIPQTKANIKKIQIYLADAERAGVINSKLAKRKKEQEKLP